MKTSIIENLKKKVGSANVLTDLEDIHVYSFECIFKEQFYPKIDAVVKVSFGEQKEKVKKFAEEEGLTLILRGSLKNLQTVPSKAGAVLLDDSVQPELNLFPKQKNEVLSEIFEEIHRTGHGTARNFALALKTLFQREMPQKCRECKTCSGYCTVASSFNNTETWSSKGRILLAKGLTKKELALSKKMVDIFYSCSACGLCFAQCVPDLQVHEAIIATRHRIAEKGLVPETFALTAKNILETGNPSGVLASQRLSWMKEGSKWSFTQKADVLLWVGCMTATRTPKTARATLSVLSEAKVDFTMLGEREECCGYVLLATGLWNEAEKVAERVIDRVKEACVETLVTPCAGCYYTFKMLYPKMLDREIPCEILHITQLVERLTRGKAIEFGNLNAKITYHDPCSLGRHGNVYESPRNVLKSIPNIEFLDMPLSKSRARCCGGGGGLLTFNTQVSMDAAAIRLMKDVTPTNANILATACPACNMNLRYASKRKAIGVEVSDVMEIVEKALLRRHVAEKQ